MPPRDTPFRENETEDKLKEKVGVGVDGQAVPQGEEWGGLKKWILPDPSSNFKATAKTSSTSSTATLCSREVEDGGKTAVDPWIRRCRIASIVGGTILGVGLIAMVIVLAVVMD